MHWRDQKQAFIYIVVIKATDTTMHTMTDIINTL
jgi:hypothetical protein